MVTVALIGADGAGKTTVARALECSGELAIKYLYMGINARACNHMLPTTRAWVALARALGRSSDQGGPPDPERESHRPRHGMRVLAHEAKATLRALQRVCEEWYRVAVARGYERRGYVVLFDRHFFADYWAHDVVAAGRSFSRRLHGHWVRRLPRPDRTILLDAPAEVLFARKAEGTLALLDRRRREYLDLARELADCVVIDASRPEDEVRGEVLRVLRECVGSSR
jgi:thymidylate kinase